MRTVTSVRLKSASRGSWQARVVTLVALAWAKLWRAKITYNDEFDLFVCSQMRAGFGRAGTTLGAAYLTKDHTRTKTLRHEAVHAEQWSRYGFTFMARYLFEEARNPKTKNRFEIEAGLADGGYVRDV
ncbi:hypothetical protein [Antrihabitans spumae]|uniref:Fe-S oxidoreductase n=1 Tax=Antrihabitans spumae TaxID=3373370 RepID=A0ABW7KCT0_9NOCA